MSCLVTSYGGWAFDLVVLLVPVIATAAIVVRSGRGTRIAGGTAVFAAVSGSALAMHAAQAPQAAFLWITPAVTAGYYVLGRRTPS